MLVMQQHAATAAVRQRLLLHGTRKACIAGEASVHETASLLAPLQHANTVKGILLLR
jgi:hypothetical protein